MSAGALNDSSLKEKDDMMNKLKDLLITIGIGGLWAAQAFAQALPDTTCLIQRLELKNAKLFDATHLIAKATGINIVASPDVYDKPVRLYLERISAREAIKTMCKLNNLWFVEEDNTIRIMKAEDYGKELTIRRDEKTYVYKLKYASCLSVAEFIQGLFGNRIEYLEPNEFESYGHVGTDKQGATGVAEQDQNQYINDSYWQDNAYRTRTKRYDSTYAATRQVQEVLKIEKDLTSKKIEELEAKKKGEPIKIEDALDLAHEKAIVYLGVFLRNNSIACRSVDLRILQDIDDLIKRVDTPTPQVLLEGKILEITLTDDFKSFFDFNMTSDSFKNTAAVGNFSALDSSTFIFQSLHNELQTRIELLEKNGQARIVGTPMILCANNAPGEFFIGEERPIVINYEQEIREFEARTTETMRPVIELRSIGTNLTITPSINEDRTVTMRFLAEIDSVNREGATISVVNQTGEIIALPIDTVDSSRVENIIVAKDNATLAVGGLIRETDENSEYKVPVLGDLPLIGLLFRKKEIEKKKTETVFLITAHLMMAPNEGEVISDKTISRVSDHPYIKRQQEHLLHYDEDNKKLKRIVKSQYLSESNGYKEKDTPQIVHVNTEANFAIIDLGTQDGIKKDDIFSVYRDGTFVGKIKVHNARLDVSSVSALGDIHLNTLREGDKIQR
ncbi:MAG TPA: hypothetical protein PLT76_02520 [Candidatus Omnitrophota bacterium]|nr:hypothetical protein [Candidatus Omnitrophota bacterium]